MLSMRLLPRVKGKNSMKTNVRLAISTGANKLSQVHTHYTAMILVISHCVD